LKPVAIIHFTFDDALAVLDREGVERIVEGEMDGCAGSEFVAAGVERDNARSRDIRMDQPRTAEFLDIVDHAGNGVLGSLSAAANGFGADAKHDLAARHALAVE
jgi:hypothetical protein